MHKIIKLDDDNIAVLVVSYCLSQIEVNKYRVNDHFWIVTRLDHEQKTCSMVECVSCDHAETIFQWCIAPQVTSQILN